MENRNWKLHTLYAMPAWLALILMATTTSHSHPGTPAEASALVIDQRSLNQLLAAASSGDLRTLAFLLDNGITPNVIDSNGASALYRAAMARQGSIVEALLRRGADPRLKTKANLRTALHESARQGDTASSQLLLKFGADENAQDIDGITPINEAARGRHKDTLDVLLAYHRCPHRLPSIQ